MSDPFIGEVRLFGGNFAPVGWALCNGGLLSIAEYPTLFSLIGVTYGGDGVTNFAVPDLRSRLPLNQGQGPSGSTYFLGESGGLEQVPLNPVQLPPHQHSLNATTATGSNPSPGSGVVLATPVEQGVNATLYTVPGSSVVNLAPMAPESIGMTGGGQPHTNMMPTLAVSYIIALEGIFPSRN